MKAADIDLPRMLQFEPATGRILFGGERMLLFRQDAFAAFRRLLLDQLGPQLSRAILAQFGYRCGSGDFQALNRGTYVWDSEGDQFAAGPVMHIHEGIVHVTPLVVEFDRAAGSFLMQGEWRNSYEAEIHLAEFGRATEPVCHTLTGYATGWTNAFFGKETLAIETLCVGRGDPVCHFEIRNVAAWGPEAEPWRRALDTTHGSLAQELEAKLHLIERQAAAIRELSTPVMEIWDDILMLPIVGVVDTRRSMDIMNNLLQTIVARQAKSVIVDVTGVEVVDTKTADYLLKVVRAANLLGARCVLTGLSPAVAQTLVMIGADLAEVKTLRNPKEGLRYCLRTARQAQGETSSTPRDSGQA